MAHRSTMLFDAAVERMHEKGVTGYRERLLFIADDIITSLTENKLLLMFISKNLGLGFYHFTMENEQIVDYPSIHNAYQMLLEDTEGKISDPKLMLYMIIELVGSSIYSSILYEQPVDIETLKPYLYRSINAIIDQFEL